MTQLARTEPNAEILEKVVIGGDLSKLTSAQRLEYYGEVCKSLGLNPLTKPFQYITFQGKLTLYASKDCTEQLRKIHGISISTPHIEYVDDLVIVTVNASDRDGRTDSDMGAVVIKGLQGEAKSNAMMKAITKAKRRVTLSISGLGMLDESETDSVPGAQTVTVDHSTGEIKGIEAPTPKPRTKNPAKVDWNSDTWWVYMNLVAPVFGIPDPASLQDDETTRKQAIADIHAQTHLALKVESASEYVKEHSIQSAEDLVAIVMNAVMAEGERQADDANANEAPAYSRNADGEPEAF